MWTDTHLGVRNGHGIFEEHIMRFHDTMLEYIKTNSIKTIIHLGDFFDNRLSINVKSWHTFKNRFLDKLKDIDVNMYILLGNHDVFFKNNNVVNSLGCIVDPQYSNIHIISEPTNLQLGSTSFLLVPWMHNSHFDEYLDVIKNSTADILCAHLELKGFVIHPGVVSIEGMEPGTFEHFDSVFSGHYHIKSSKGNVHYLGTPYDLVWSDVFDKKFFHIFNSETSQLTPVEYCSKLFVREVYADVTSDIDHLIERLKETNLSGKYVKLIVREKTNPLLFESVINIISNKQPQELSIVDETILLGRDWQSTDASVEDVVTILNNAVDTLSNSENVDKERLKLMLSETYIKAIQEEVAS